MEQNPFRKNTRYASIIPAINNEYFVNHSISRQTSTLKKLTENTGKPQFVSREIETLKSDIDGIHRAAIKLFEGRPASIEFTSDAELNHFVNEVLSKVAELRQTIRAWPNCVDLPDEYPYAGYSLGARKLFRLAPTSFKL